MGAGMSAKSTAKQRAGAKWLERTRGREFLTFSHATIYRVAFPLGGYVYRVHKNGDVATALYHGNDEAAIKLIYLALRNITTDWGRASRDWKEAMNQFAILYEDRFTNKVH